MDCIENEENQVLQGMKLGTASEPLPARLVLPRAIGLFMTTKGSKVELFPEGVDRLARC